MSKNNNIFTKTYIETQKLTKAFLLKEIERVETDKLKLRYSELRNAIVATFYQERAAQEAAYIAAKLAEELRLSEEAKEMSSASTEIPNTENEITSAETDKPTNDNLDITTVTESDKLTGADVGETTEVQLNETTNDNLDITTVTESDKLTGADLDDVVQPLSNLQDNTTKTAELSSAEFLANAAAAEAISELITIEEAMAAQAEIEKRIAEQLGPEDIYIKNNLKLDPFTKLTVSELYFKQQDTFKEFSIDTTLVTFLNSIKDVEELTDLDFNKYHNMTDGLHTLSQIPVNYSSVSILNLLFFKFLKIKYNLGFKRLKKIKVRKWKYKKRKLRKLYILKKWKRVLVHKRFRTFTAAYNFFNITTTMNDGSIERTTLFRRMPIAEKLINDANLEFFYKLNKDSVEEFNDYIELLPEEQILDEDFMIYLRNYYQKPYWKFRKARILHWNMFFKKTIRKQRYKGFISKYIKRYAKRANVLSVLANFFTYFNLSWSRTNNIDILLKNNLVQKITTHVYKLPFSFFKAFHWKILKKKNYYKKKKAGKWSYLNFKRYMFPWLQKKKNFPKLIKHLQANPMHLKHNTQFDIMTNYLYVPSILENYTMPTSNEFKVNYFLKLHMYRYKANNKCFSL